MVQSIKRARASRHFPACIFSMCIAWPGCRRELLGRTQLLGILFPLVRATSSPSGQGPWARPTCFGKRSQPCFPLPCHRAGGKCLRTQLPIPALQRSWRSITGTAGDGRLVEDTDPGRNPFGCLWALLVSLPFSQPVDKTDNFVRLCVGFFQDSQGARDFGGRYNQLAIHQPTRPLRESEGETSTHR